MKEPVKKKHPKQKNAIKAANTSAKKGKGTKFGRDKKSDNVNAGGYGQSKPSNKRKGKVTVLEFDSDDGSLDLDDEEGYAQLLEQVKQESKHDIKLLLIGVSPPFVNVANGFAYYLITFPKAGKLFLLKPEFYVTNIKIVYKKRKALAPKLKDDGGWIDTINLYHMRNIKFGDESVYRKTANNNTVDLIYFIHAVALSDEESFLPLLEYRMKYFFDVCKKRKGNATGMNALNFVHNLRTGDDFGLEGWALKRAGGDVAKAAKMITDDMNDYYGGGYALQYDVPLNRYMVDYDIKQFLTTYVGVTSWDDLTEDDKKKCFKNYPKKSLPD